MLTSVTLSILIAIHFLQNFETAVQENITINGEPWQETSDEDELQSGVCLVYLISLFYAKHLPYC